MEKFIFLFSEVSKFSLGKGSLCYKTYHTQGRNVYFTVRNLLESGDPMELKFNFLKCKNEIYQRIEL